MVRKVKRLDLFVVFSLVVIVVGFNFLLATDGESTTIDSFTNSLTNSFTYIKSVSSGNLLTGAAIGVQDDIGLQGNIGIQADCGGATNCSCGDTVINNYTMTGDLSCTIDGLNVGASNIVINCSGYSIIGDGGAPDSGIKNFPGPTNSYTNVTIKNCIIKNFGTGINFQHSPNATIWNNTVGHINLTEPDFGISFVNSSGANISNNIVTNITGTGIDSLSGIFYAEAPTSSINDSVINNNNISYLYGNNTFIPFGIKIGDPAINDLNGLEINNNVIHDISCMDGCAPVGGGIGILISAGTNINITNNNFSSLAAGIIPDVTNLQIIGNHFSSLVGIGTQFQGSTTKFNHSLVENNAFDGCLKFGVDLQDPVYNNTFLNNNFSSNNFDIVDLSTKVNYLIYNNSFGEIKWDALANMTFSNDLALGTNLFIGENIVALNSTSERSNFNGTANITLNNLNFINITEIYRVNNYSTTSAKISSAGTDCNGTSCSTLTYAGNNLLFNTSSFSSFSANGTIDNPPVVTLVAPADGYTNDSAATVDVLFNCSVTDDVQLVNMSLYLTDTANSSFALNQSTNIAGTSNSTNWTLSLGVGNYTWNCLAFDNLSNSSFATSNNSIALNNTAAASLACGDTITSDTTLSADLSCTANGLVVGASNIVINCSGYSIVGDGGAPDSGIVNLPSASNSYTNVTVKNCIIENFGTGINFQHSPNATIWNNTVGHINLTEPNWGISFTNSSGANISNNIVTNITATGIDSLSGIFYAEAPTSFLNDSVINNNNISYLYGNNTFTPFAIKIGDASINDLHGLEVDNNVIHDISCMDGCQPFGGGFGILISSGTNINITNNNISSSGVGIMPDQTNLQIIGNRFSSNIAGIGTFFQGSTVKFNHSLVENNTFESLTIAVNIFDPVFNNTFLNNNFSSNTQDIVDDSTKVNYLIYNNSFGEIKWDALTNMAFSNDLSLDTNLLIGDNIVAFNSSGFEKLNGSANITLNGLSYLNITEIYRVNNYSTTSAKVSSTGTDCNGTSCSTLTYAGNNLLFNTTNFSSFSANGSFDNPPVVTLNNPPDPNVIESPIPVELTFNCSATDDIQLANISLYLTNPSNSSFALNQSTTVSGTTNNSNWTLELGWGNYTWNCLAFDNISNSSFATSNRSISITAQPPAPPSDNNAPNVTTPVITPTTAYTNDTLIANTTYNDTGGSSSATVYFLWSVNNINIFNQTNTSVANGTTVITSLDANNFSKSNLINVSVYANNSTNVSDTLWSTVLTISNLVPEASSVNISSSDSLNRSNGTLTGTFTYTDTDNDAQASSETEWYNGSTKIDNLDNFTSIDANNLSKSDVWIFSVRVNDSTDFSSWTNSSNMTIADAEPVTYCGGNYTSGNWVINASVNCSNEVIPVDGLMTIQDNSETAASEFSTITNAYYDLSSNSTVITDAAPDLDKTTPTEYTDDWISGAREFYIVMNESEHQIQMYLNVTPDTNYVIGVDVDNDATSGTSVGGDNNGLDLVFGYFDSYGGYIVAVQNFTLDDIQAITSGDEITSDMDPSLAQNYTVYFDNSSNIFEVVVNITGDWVDKKIEATDLAGTNIYTTFKNSSLITTGTGNLTLNNITLGIGSNLTVSGILTINNSNITVNTPGANTELKFNSLSTTRINHTDIQSNDTSNYSFYVAASNFVIENGQIDDLCNGCGSDSSASGVALVGTGGIVNNITFGSDMELYAISVYWGTNVLVSNNNVSLGTINVEGVSITNNTIKNNLVNQLEIGDTVSACTLSDNVIYTTLNFGGGDTNNFNNLFLNNNLSTATILDLTNSSLSNYFIYNNSFGQINWSGSNFTLGGSGDDIDLNIGTGFYIENNTLGIDDNSSFTNFNTSAELTFYGLSYSSTPTLNKSGVRCDNSGLCNISYDSTNGILYANVTGFSNYTTQASNNAPVFDQNLTNQSIEFATAFNYDVNCSDNDGETITYYDNTSLFNINSSNGYINDTSTISELGNYTINISCDDGTVNTSQTFIYSIVDTSSPTILINAIAPNNGSVVDFNLTTNENATCQYKNNSNSLANMVETGNITHFQNVTNLSAGDHQYNFSCTDNSSNAATATLNFVVTSTTTLNQSSTSLNLTGNVSSTVNVISGVNLTFNVSTTLGENTSVSVAEYNETPLTTNFSVTGSTVSEYKYYVIDAPSITDSINWITLKFTYNETDVVAAGIAEADLGIFFYNATSSTWQEEISVVNTDENYIEANVSHLSTFVLGKSTVTAAAATATAAASGSSSSGGNNAWGLCGDGNCNDGLTCAPDVNTNNNNGACYKDCGICSEEEKLDEEADKAVEQKSETDETETVDSATAGEENLVDTIGDALVGKAWAGYKTVLVDLTWLWIGLIILFVIGWFGAYTHHKSIIKTERKKVKIHFGENVEHLESNFKVFFNKHKDVFKVIFKVLLVLLILTGLGLAAYLIYPNFTGESDQGDVVAEDATIVQEAAVIEESAMAEGAVEDAMAGEETVATKFAHALSGQAWGRYKTVFVDLTWLWIGLIVLFVIGWLGAYTHHKNIIREERKKVKINFGESVKHLESNFKNFFRNNKEIFLIIFKILIIIVALFVLGLAIYLIYSYFSSGTFTFGIFSLGTITSFIKTLGSNILGLGIWLIPLAVLIVSVISLVVFHFYKKRK